MAEDILKQPIRADAWSQDDPTRKLVAEVNEKFDRWRQNRRPHEIQWFINASFIRGLQWVVWNDALNKLEVRDVPSHRIRLTINRILPKIKARAAKFLKTRFTPIVVPASSDREDKLNARASEKALEYCLRKNQSPRKYRQTLGWTQTCGKGFIWLYWDPAKEVSVKDTMTGEVVEAPLGDVVLEAGSPFELFVSDPGMPSLADQPEIMRVKMRPIADIKKRYAKAAQNIKGESAPSEIFQYQQQIANLSAKGTSGLVAGWQDDPKADEKTYVAVKELFTAPNGDYPKGRYVVVAGEQLLRQQDELPYGFHKDDNPYPVVEFSDMELAGQFWPTTYVEQMIGIQKEYNLVRSKVAEQIKLMAHPKVIVSTACRWPEGAWTSEAGEVIRVVLPPGVPAPQVVNPPNIAQDAWNVLNLTRQEFDEVTNIWPAMQGGVGQASSGFQTNLLQEAADSVHAPDIRAHEEAFEDLCRKIRRIMAQGYAVPRLVSIVGRAHLPDVEEFSADQIDEHAEIVVYTGSALSSSPAVRTQQVIELWNSKMLGDPANPEVQRRALTMLDNNGIGELQEETRRDEEQSRLENLYAQQGKPVDLPMPWENHEIHWTVHTDQFKTPDFKMWDKVLQRELVKHALLHARWINPQMAFTLAQELGFPEILDMLGAPGAPGQQAPPPGPEGPVPPGQEGPPPGAPQGPPMPPGPPMAGPPPGPPPGPPVAGPPPGPPGPPMAPEMAAPPMMPPGPGGPPMPMLPGVVPPFSPQAMAAEPPRAMRKITRVIRDPQTNLIVGAESIEEPIDNAPSQ